MQTSRGLLSSRPPCRVLAPVGASPARAARQARRHASGQVRSAAGFAFSSEKAAATRASLAWFCDCVVSRSTNSSLYLRAGGSSEPELEAAAAASRASGELTAESPAPPSRLSTPASAPQSRSASHPAARWAARPARPSARTRRGACEPQAATAMAGWLHSGGVVPQHQAGKLWEGEALSGRASCAARARPEAPPPNKSRHATYYSTLVAR